MGPLVVEEAGDAPEDAQRFNGAGGDGATHVGCFPAEGIEDGSDGLLGGVVVSADEHGGLDAVEVGVDHGGGADGVEGFDEVGVGELVLQLLHEGVGGSGVEGEDAVIGGQVLDGIAGVDDGFPGEVAGAGETQGVGCGGAFDGEDD